MRVSTIEETRRALFDSLEAFTRFVWPIIEPDTTLAWAPYLSLLCRKLEALTLHVEARTTTTRHLVINIPPASLKSTLVTKIWPAWLWVRNPSLDIINASYSRTLATSHALASKDIVSSPLITTLFPYLRLRPDSKAKSEFATTRQGERRATSVGGTLTGFHADVLIIDDPIKPEEAESAAILSATNRWYTQTLPSRLKAGGVKVLVMQRLHESDPTSIQMAEPNTEAIILPAWLDDATSSHPEVYVEGLLNPATMPRHALAHMRNTIRERAFAAQYLQRPMPRTGNIFDPNKLQRYKLMDLLREAGDSLTWHFALDTAYTRNAANSASVCLAFAYHEGIYFIRSILRVWLNFSALINELTKFIHANGYSQRSRVLVEPKASGKDVVDVLRTHGINAIEAPNPSRDKVANAYSIQPVVDAGRVAVPANAPWLADFINELALFPYGSHDDQVDALVIAVKSKGRERKIKAFG